MLRYITVEKAFRFASDAVTLPPWKIQIEVEGVIIDPDDTECEAVSEDGCGVSLLFRKRQLRLRLTVRPLGPAADELVAVLDNIGSAPCSLGRIWLLACDEAVPLGPGAATVVLPLPGVITQRAVYRAAAEECPRESKIKTLFHNSRI